MARINTFICGHDEDGNPWSEVISQVSGNDLYTKEGKITRLNGGFDEYEVMRMTEAEFQEAYKMYRDAMLKLIFEVGGKGKKK